MNLKKSEPSKVKIILILVAAGLVLAGVGYGAGRIQGHMALKDAETTHLRAQETATKELSDVRGDLRQELAEVRTEAEQERGRLESKVATVSNRMERLEARRQLDRVLLSLDDRNFGIAQSFLENAVARLTKVQETSEAEDALIKTLAEDNVIVAGNLQTQRSRIREHINSFDTLLDGENP